MLQAQRSCWNPPLKNSYVYMVCDLSLVVPSSHQSRVELTSIPANFPDIPVEDIAFNYYRRNTDCDRMGERQRTSSKNTTIYLLLTPFFVVWSFRLLASWLVSLRQCSSLKFPSFYPPPPECEGPENISSDVFFLTLPEEKIVAQEYLSDTSMNNDILVRGWALPLVYSCDA